jgi:L-iditol 2-dehydrogenase
VKSVGICGSDVHYWTHGRIGNFIVNAPMVLGHESSGQVVEVGSNVKGLQKGDRVTMEPGVPCRMCRFCKEGRYNLCPDVRFMATPPIDGSLANLIVHPADHCFKLPDNVSFEEGAMCEPLSVGIHSCNRANITIGSRVLITGAGPIGLVCLLAAKAAGATFVACVDVKEDRLNVAKSLGADAIVVAGKDMSHLGQFDATIECSGAEPAIRTAIHSTRSGGVVVLVGLGPAEIKLPIVDAAVREVDIRGNHLIRFSTIMLLGIFRYANCYPKALELIASGKVNVKPLITHRYSLQQVIEAFEVARDMQDKSGKQSIKVCVNI